MRNLLIPIVCLVLLSACELIKPTLPPPPPHYLTKDSSLFTKLEAIQAKQSEKACKELWAALGASLACDPQTTPQGPEMHCLMESPIRSFTLQCTESAESKDFNYSITWEENAGATETLFKAWGPCEIYSSGPMARKAPRYKGDRGMVVCLWPDNTEGFISAMRSYPDNAIPFPSGLYLDFFDHMMETTMPLKSLETDLEQRSPAISLTLRASSERLQVDEKAALWQYMLAIFNRFYRETESTEN